MATLEIKSSNELKVQKQKLLGKLRVRRDTTIALGSKILDLDKDYQISTKHEVKWREILLIPDIEKGRNKHDGVFLLRECYRQLLDACNHTLYPEEPYTNDTDDTLEPETSILNPESAQNLYCDIHYIPFLLKKLQNFEDIVKSLPKKDAKETLQGKIFINIDKNYKPTAQDFDTILSIFRLDPENLASSTLTNKETPFDKKLEVCLEVLKFNASADPKFEEIFKKFKEIVQKAQLSESEAQKQELQYHKSEIRCLGYEILDLEKDYQLSTEDENKLRDILLIPDIEKGHNKHDGVFLLRECYRQLLDGIDDILNPEPEKKLCRDTNYIPFLLKKLQNFENIFKSLPKKHKKETLQVKIHRNINKNYKPEDQDLDTISSIFRHVKYPCISEKPKEPFNIQCRFAYITLVVNISADPKFEEIFKKFKEIVQKAQEIPGTTLQNPEVAQVSEPGTSRQV